MSEWIGQAEGLTKKSAAQNAAREVLSRLSEPPESTEAP